VLCWSGDFGVICHGRTFRIVVVNDDVGSDDGLRTLLTWGFCFDGDSRREQL
jgi:hypothetical protein